MLHRKLILLALLALVSSGAAPLVFGVQPGTPAALPNFVQPEAGCSWTGIGGHVFDLNGDPLSGFVIALQGSLEGSPISKYAISGSALQIGPGGYEMMVADHLVAVQQSDLKIQLQDIAGQNLTAAIPVRLFENCQQNLLLINFIQLGTHNFMPLLKK